MIIRSLELESDQRLMLTSQININQNKVQQDKVSLYYLLFCCQIDRSGLLYTTRVGTSMQKKLLVILK